MASDRPGYFQRLKNSVVGFLFGMAMFLLAIPFLAWNENNVYKVRQGLKEGAKVVQSVSAQPESSRNETLIHIGGEVSTSKGVSDPVFGLEYDMLRLERTVEMYQWEEDRKTRDGKTTYTYDRKWSERRIDSSNFNQAGHDNPPPPPFSSEDFVASDAQLGGYGVDRGQILEAGGLADLAGVQLPSQMVGQGWSGGNGSTWFRGRGTLQSPQVGDVRVSFRALPEGPLSLVGMQRGERLVPWISGRKTEVLLVERGMQTAESMFENAQSRNSAFGWAMRAAGFAAMWMGLGLCLGPMSAVLSFLPGLSGVVSRVSGWLAFVVAMVFAVITIMLSWVIVRPLVLMLVVGGLVAIALIIGRMRDQRQGTAGPPPAPFVASAPPPMPPPPPPPR